MLATADEETIDVSIEDPGTPDFLKPAVLSVGATAAYLDINRSTVYRYIEQGKLGTFLHGGRTFIPKRSIADYVQSLIDQSTRDQSRAARANKQTTR